MLKHFALLTLCVSFAYGQNSAAPLTNETVIKLVASGVPAETVINTIRAASSVSFGFLPGDLDLLQRYHVPDDVVKAMSAKSYGRPMPQVSAPSVQISPPRQSAPRAELSSAPTPSPESLTNDSLVKLVKAGMGEDTIVGIVNSQPGRYSLSTDSLISLKQAGVSDKIISAMVNRNAGGTRSVNAAQPSSAETLTLRDATPIRLRLTRNLSSADAKTGDTVDFEVLEDLKVDDVLVIARGATAIATVTEAQACSLASGSILPVHARQGLHDPERYGDHSLRERGDQTRQAKANGQAVKIIKDPENAVLVLRNGSEIGRAHV